MIDADQIQLIIDRGQRATHLLADETFRWIVDDQTNYHLAALVAARPVKDADAISYHHTLQHALMELVSSLQGHAEVGRKMEEALAKQAEDEDDDDAEQEDDTDL